MSQSNRQKRQIADAGQPTSRLHRKDAAQSHRSRAEPDRFLRIGIDTGGTFTDVVVAHGPDVSHFKLPSTPHNPAEAILAGIARVFETTASEALPSGHSHLEIVHGTTVATNALLERKGARTALVTTDGFEDVIEIGRQTRPELYNLMVTRPAPLVSRDLRFGLKERIATDGKVLVALEQSEVKDLADLLLQKQVESVAVCFLFSFANSRHERLVGRLLKHAFKNRNIPLSLSHEILPEYREYERTSTVVINAYLAPVMSRYLNALSAGLKELTGGPDQSARPIGSSRRGSQDASALRVMQSNGGSVSAETAAAEPVRAILSGPAGGVVGALKVCQDAGFPDIVTFDMGGTSTDVALCRGRARTTNEASVAGLPVAIPIIDIHTVGAGGGSIARVDAAGALRVGPQSAGADPGPACYGRGEAVTVTDANLILGRFGGASLLGGDMPLDAARARRFLSVLAADMSRHASGKVTAERAALGVISVANANMERALRAVSIERGHDPRLFTLVSFGGGGGLHVCDLASALRIPRIVIPRSPGTLSALGVLLGDVVKDYSRTVMLRSGSIDWNETESQLAGLEAGALADLEREGFGPERVQLNRSAAVRYIGQSFEIDVPLERNRKDKSSVAKLTADFNRAHLERYGYCDPSRKIEVVSLRLRAAGITVKPRLRKFSIRARNKAKPSGTERVYFGTRPETTPVYARGTLTAGARLAGPAIITEYSSTTLIPQGRKVQVDPWLNLIIT